MSTGSAQMAAVLASEDAAWLGRWRALPGYEACEAESRLWVRGPEHDDWRLLPALERYTVDEAQRLTPPGGRVPRRKLPEGQWQPLVDFLKVRSASALLPGQGVLPIAWRLVPAEQYREPTLLVLPFEELARWGLSAPELRLKPLKFALAEDGRACVSGHPLPALPGERWYMEEGIAVRAGWALPLGITAGLVAGAVQMQREETILLHEDAAAERLPHEAWVEMSRAAIRVSMEKKT